MQSRQAEDGCYSEPPSPPPDKASAPFPTGQDDDQVKGRNRFALRDDQQAKDEPVATIATSEPSQTSAKKGNLPTERETSTPS